MGGVMHTVDPSLSPEDSPRAWQKIEPMFELVGRIQAAKILACVLSNVIPSHAEDVRARGWYAPFDHLFLSCEIDLWKPDIWIYRHVVDKLGFLPGNFLYVDDLEVNLVPAYEHGMKVLLAVDPQKTVSAVEEIIGLR